MTHDITITLDFSSYEYNVDFFIQPDALISSGNLIIDWGDNTSETASPHEYIGHTYQCGNIYTITIDGVSDIGDGFLSQNGDVTEIALSSNITTIGDDFCAGTHITKMIIPNSITSIGEFFCADSALNAIHIPSNVTTIDRRFCYMCSNLRAVSFSTGLTEVGKDFVGKTLVSRLEFPEGLLISGGFADAPSINTIIYPSSINDIGQLIFENGSFAPQKIVFKSRTPPAAANRWENFDGIIYVPEGCINSYIEYATETDTFPADPSYYKENLTLPRALDRFGALMRANLEKQGIETQRNDGLTTLINKVNDIQDFNDIFEFDSTNDYVNNGFGMMYDSAGHSYFTLKIPSIITTLGNASFDGFTEMKICEIPSSVVSIRNNVFRQNSSLEKIIFKGSTPPSVTSRSFVTNSPVGYLNIPTTCVIEVPCSALSTYKSAINYPDPTVYTYQCIRFDEKCDSSNGLSNFDSPIPIYLDRIIGNPTITYNSQENAYELLGTGLENSFFPIIGLNGISNLKISCEIKTTESEYGDGRIGLGVTPPGSGSSQTVSSTFANIAWISDFKSNKTTPIGLLKIKRGAQLDESTSTVTRTSSDWMRIIMSFDSSNGFDVRYEELDGTELGTFTGTVSSQLSDRYYGIYLKDVGQSSVNKIYIRNIKCIGY